MGTMRAPSTAGLTLRPRRADHYEFFFDSRKQIATGFALRVAFGAQLVESDGLSLRDAHSEFHCQSPPVSGVPWRSMPAHSRGAEA